MEKFRFIRPSFRELRLKPGIRWKVSVVDTRGMTIGELPCEYEGSFRVDLPRRQYCRRPPFCILRTIRTGLLPRAPRRPVCKSPKKRAA
jgi:hypothetical protein